MNSPRTRSTRPSTARSLTAAAYIFAVVMMGTTLPTPLYPTMSAAFGFGSAATTVLFAVYAVGVVAGLVIFGGLSDTLGRRPVLALALGLSVLSALLFLVAGLPAAGSGAEATGGTAAGLVLMYLGRILSGFAAGIFTGTGTVTVMENAPEGRATLAAAVSTAANIGGLGLGVLVAGCVAAVVDRPLVWPFVVHALMLAVAVLLCATGWNVAEVATSVATSAGTGDGCPGRGCRPFPPRCADCSSPQSPGWSQATRCAVSSPRLHRPS